MKSSYLSRETSADFSCCALAQAERQRGRVRIVICTFIIGHCVASLYWKSIHIEWIIDRCILGLFESIDWFNLMLRTVFWKRELDILYYVQESEGAETQKTINDELSPPKKHHFSVSELSSLNPKDPHGDLFWNSPTSKTSSQFVVQTLKDNANEHRQSLLDRQRELKLFISSRGASGSRPNSKGLTSRIKIRFQVAEEVGKWHKRTVFIPERKDESDKKKK